MLLIRNVTAHDGIEVLLIQRHYSMSFGGAYAFPGGMISEEDYSPYFHHLSHYFRGRIAIEITELNRFVLPYFIGCIRECFEETGVLLATTNDSTTCDYIQHVDRKKLIQHQNNLNKKQTTLLTICSNEAIIPAIMKLTYIGNWVTPRSEKKRYSTRFFIAPMPAGQNINEHSSEILDSFWIKPESALDKYSRGDFKMYTPTVQSLQAISGYETIENLIDSKSNFLSENIKTFG